MSNVFDLFHHPDKADAACLLSDGGEPVATFGDMDRRSARYANHFTAQGLKPGDRVSVQVEKSPENLVIYLACLRAGLTYLPLNTAYQEDEVAYFLGNARPALSICDPARRQNYEKIATGNIATLDAGGVYSDAAVATAADTFTSVATLDTDIAVILYTSGTTGNPKGAMISHGNLASNAQTLIDAWQWQPSDIILHSLPIFHIHGLFVACHLPLASGTPIILLPRFDPELVINNLPQATVFMGVPTHYTRLLADERFTAARCANMRLFTSGSAPLLPQTFDEFTERTGQQIVERYGMTETGMNTSNPLDGKRKAGTVGPPLPGVECRIVDDANNPVATGETGNLEVRGANVFKGYWEMPEKTAADFTADGFFRTGDLASLDDDGYVAIVGRNKDMVISGGLNVYPREIEAILDELPGVIESAVIGVPDPDFGEVVVAVVVTEDGAIDGDGIIADLKSRIANFKVPKAVIGVTELPRNTMGKVQKNRLREQYGDIRR